MVTISGLYSHAQKSSKRSRFCAVCDKKETVVPECLLRTFDVQQSVMLFMGVSKLGRMVRNGPDFYWCWSEDQWREVLLTRKLLPVMCEICSELFIFQQSNAPAHRACKTINILERDPCRHYTRLFATQQHSKSKVKKANLYSALL